MSTGKGAKGNPSVTMNDVNAAIEKSEERQRKMLNEGIASVKERVDEKFQEIKDMMELFMESVEKKEKVQRVEFQKEEVGGQQEEDDDDVPFTPRANSERKFEVVTGLNTGAYGFTRKLKEKKRRDSVLLRLGALDSKRSATTPVTYTRDLPPYEDIKLQYLDAENVFEFLMAIQEYISKYGTVPPAATMMSKQVAIRICERCQISQMALVQQSLDELTGTLAAASRVETQKQFREVLTKIAEKPWKNKKYTQLNPMVFYNFYFHLLKYSEDFVEGYNFLAIDTPEKVVPRLDHKPGGILKIFIDSIPCNYGNNVFDDMDKKRRTSIEEFVTDFMEIAREHFKESQQTRSLSDWLSTTSSKRSDPATPKTSAGSQQLRNVEEDQFARDERESMLTWEAHAQAVMDSLTDDEMPENFDEKKILDRKPTVEEQEEESKFSQNFQQSQTTSTLQRGSMDVSKGSSTFPGACFKKVLNGTCLDRSCKYAHDAASIEEKTISMRAVLERRFQELQVKKAQASSVEKKVPARAPLRPPPEPPPTDVLTLRR
jgi:hypothetical protein